MVEQTQRVFFEEEREDYGKNLGHFTGTEEKKATRLSVQVFLEDGEPIRYEFYPGPTCFTKEQ